jgi:hypothetical protein
MTYFQICSLCNNPINEENCSDSDLGFCLDCYEEYGDEWPDRI